MLLKEGIDADDGQDAGQRDVQKLLEAARAIDGGDFVQLFVHAGKRGATKPPPVFVIRRSPAFMTSVPGNSSVKPIQRANQKAAVLCTFKTTNTFPFTHFHLCFLDTVKAQ